MVNCFSLTWPKHDPSLPPLCSASSLALLCSKETRRATYLDRWSTVALAVVFTNLRGTTVCWREQFWFRNRKLTCVPRLTWSGCSHGRGPDVGVVWTPAQSQRPALLCSVWGEADSPRHPQVPNRLLSCFFFCGSAPPLKGCGYRTVPCDTGRSHVTGVSVFLHYPHLHWRGWCHFPELVFSTCGSCRGRQSLFEEPSSVQQSEQPTRPQSNQLTN